MPSSVDSTTCNTTLLSNARAKPLDASLKRIQGKDYPIPMRGHFEQALEGLAIPCLPTVFCMSLLKN